MSTVTIDQSTKLILEYIEKLRGKSTQKRQKLNEPTLAIRPSDFPGISTQQLCDILIRFAFNGSYVDDIFRDHLLKLVVDKSITWNQVIHSVINTKVDGLYLKSQLCVLIREMVHYVQIKSFDDQSHADALIAIMKPTLLFLTQLILDLLSDEDELDTMQIDFDDPFRAYQKPLEALSALIHDDLCSTLLSIHNSSEITHQLQLCLGAFSKLRNPDKSATSLMEMLLENYLEKCKPTKYEYTPELMVMFDLKNPSIRMLVPIFACFKSHECSTLMAGTIQTIAEFMKVPGEDVIFDLLHSSILLKCEESMDLLHLPKQHRVDFRWQSTTFFYKKLPQIIGNLVGKGKVTAKDVRIGLDRALNDLSMMFDSADVAWQNASFLTLLNELEPYIGKEAADPLRQRRREHMKTTANLIPFAETDNKLIENTEIDKLLTAVKEVMNLHFGQHEEFWQLFVDKVKNGEFDDFDAVTSILTAEGKMMEAGKTFALKNKEAQEPSISTSVQERIRIFDETFLLLSRIIIKNPSLSIKLLINGGQGKSEAEQTIFYKWSMRFVKRVVKHAKLQQDSEKDRERLRREVDMLERLANLEVGIEDGEEEEEEERTMEEEKEERIVDTIGDKIQEAVETIKLEEPMEEIVKDESKKPGEIEDEKMDISELPAGPSEPLIDPIEAEHFKQIEEPMPAEEAKTVEEIPESPKKPKKDPEITWYDVNCPLPRVTKKTARSYLSMLKEGHPFWRTDDQNLNLGSVVAAIPKIGQLLIEEHEDKRHRFDRKSAEENMTSILHAIETMPCLFLCLVEWLDCEPDSDARTSLAITMKASLEKCITSSTTPSSDGKNHSKWKFIQSTVQQIIYELIDKSPAFPEVTCTAFSTARRFCPFVARNEKPDQVKLKHAWYYIRQQEWASPHALRLLNHANIAGYYDAWSHIFISKTIKSGCGELMKSSVDMIFSFMTLDELNSIVRIHESLMEFWLSEDARHSQTNDTRFDPLSVRAVIRLMTHVMLMAEWALDRLINEEPPLVERLHLTETSEVPAPEPEDPDSREKWIFLLKSMLERTVNRFFKILRRGLLCTVVNAIIQLVKSIAGVGECHAKRLLVRRIPPKLIFQLAYIEPTAVDYPLINVFCDPNNEEHTRTKIMFLCALRRAKVF